MSLLKVLKICPHSRGVLLQPLKNGQYNLRASHGPLRLLVHTNLDGGPLRLLVHTNLDGGPLRLLVHTILDSGLLRLLVHTNLDGGHSCVNYESLRVYEWGGGTS